MIFGKDWDFFADIHMAVHRWRLERHRFHRYPDLYPHNNHPEEPHPDWRYSQVSIITEASGGEQGAFIGF